MGGQPLTFPFGLAPDGVYTTSHVTMRMVVSYTAFSPLPAWRAVIFCCTVPGVTSAGRYPASCPVEPGLSSRACRLPRSSVSLKVHYTTRVKLRVISPGHSEKPVFTRICAKILRMPPGTIRKIFTNLIIFLSDIKARTADKLSAY